MITSTTCKYLVRTVQVFGQFLQGADDCILIEQDPAQPGGGGEGGVPLLLQGAQRYIQRKVTTGLT